MPNKTKQNTKNSTEQICSQPLYKSQTTHHTQPTPTTRWPAARATTTFKAAHAHTVLNVNPTVCLLAAKRLCPTHTRTHTHHPTTRAVNTCRHKKTNPHANHNRPARTLVPHNGLPRKEVIQPHLPVRLPCYDFVPIANPTFDHSPHQRG